MKSVLDITSVLDIISPYITLVNICKRFCVIFYMFDVKYVLFWEPVHDSGSVTRFCLCLYELNRNQLSCLSLL